MEKASFQPKIDGLLLKNGEPEHWSDDKLSRFSLAINCNDGETYGDVLKVCVQQFELEETSEVHQSYVYQWIKIP